MSNSALMSAQLDNNEVRLRRFLAWHDDGLITKTEYDMLRGDILVKCGLNPNAVSDASEEEALGCDHFFPYIQINVNIFLCLSDDTCYNSLSRLDAFTSELPVAKCDHAISKVRTMLLVSLFLYIVLHF